MKNPDAVSETPQSILASAKLAEKFRYIQGVFSLYAKDLTEGHKQAISQICRDNGWPIPNDMGELLIFGSDRTAQLAIFGVLYRTGAWPTNRVIRPPAQAQCIRASAGRLMHRLIGFLTVVPPVTGRTMQEVANEMRAITTQKERAQYLESWQYELQSNYGPDSARSSIKESLMKLEAAGLLTRDEAVGWNAISL